MIKPLANFFHRTTFRRQISVSVAVGVFFLALFSSLALLIERHAPEEGMFETIIPGVGLLRWNRPTVLRRGVLRPSVCIVV